FSLGCLLFRCLTDTEAFAGSRALTALAKLVLLEPSRVAELRPDVPAALDELVAHLLAKDREERPGSAAEVRDALEQIAEGSAGETAQVGAGAASEDATGPESAPGTVFGRYEIEGRLGAGGVGKVYRARDTILGRAVALKVLRRTDGETRAHLLREARAAAKLNHPNIVTLYDVGEHDGVPFLAMECAPGRALRAYVGDPSVGIARRVRWMSEVARGLAAAHAAGLVHGDVKPDNVWIGDDDVVKVLDFGLATAVPGCIAGTAAYMAPEQIRGEPLDGRTDQFAWGVTAYELFAGRLPLAGDDPVATMASVLSGEAVTLSDAERATIGLPREVADVLAKVLRKSRDERFPSMDALLTALEASPHKVAPRRLRRAKWLGLVPVLTGLVLLLRAQTGRHEVPTASNTAAPSATAITALPISPKCVPAAVGLYSQGLRALRESRWRQALHLFEQASDADPSCPEVQLRLTMFSEWYWPRARQREQLHRTQTLRDVLSERDRLLLDVSASMLEPETPRRDEAIRILDEATRKFPGDAELLTLAAFRRSRAPLQSDQHEALLELTGRAISLDPNYADAWCDRGQILGRMGRPEEELGALDQCLKIAPGATDCMEIRSGTLRRLGRSDEAAAEARRWISWEPDQQAAYHELSLSLAWGGASRAAVEEALLLRWSHVQAEERELTRLCDSARLAFLMGDFEDALRVSRNLESQATGSASNQFHFCATQVSVEANVEVGRGERAAAIAERFRERNQAWFKGETSLGFLYREMYLLAVELEHGNLTPAQWREAGDAWERFNERTMDPIERWLFRWGPAVGAQIQGSEALSHDPRVDAALVARASDYSSNFGVLEAYEGRLHLYAGDAAKAVPLLEKATRSCPDLEHAALHVQAHLWLGLAREKVGDRAGACDAYRGVLQRWGKAKPPSVTAQEADRRSRALGCSR
ncbi:MAG TPA: protein kinase, partial [Polyangiaceae bacterium]|nr:protein kinase [Polyangiaceae bacterium]